MASLCPGTSRKLPGEVGLVEEPAAGRDDEDVPVTCSYEGGASEGTSWFDMLIRVWMHNDRWSMEVQVLYPSFPQVQAGV
jgi:hypothetical protein